MANICSTGDPRNLPAGACVLSKQAACGAISRHILGTRACRALRHTAVAACGGVVVQQQPLQAFEQAQALQRILGRQGCALRRQQHTADRLVRAAQQPAPQQHIRLDLIQALHALEIQGW